MNVSQLDELPDDILCIIIAQLDLYSYESFRRTSKRARRVVDEVYDIGPNSSTSVLAETRAYMLDNKDRWSDFYIKQLCTGTPINRLVAEFIQYCRLANIVCRFDKIRPEMFDKYIKIHEAYTKEILRYYYPVFDSDKIMYNFVDIYSDYYIFINYTILVIIKIFLYETSICPYTPCIYYDRYIPIISATKQIYLFVSYLINISHAHSVEKFVEKLLSRYYYPEYYIPVAICYDHIATIKHFSYPESFYKYQQYITSDTFKWDQYLPHFYNMLKNSGLNTADYTKVHIVSQNAKARLKAHIINAPLSTRPRPGSL